MSTMKEILHKKREVTEKHIKQRQVFHIHRST